MGKKITQYPPSLGNPDVNSLLDISEKIGLAFASRSLTIQQLKDLFTGDEIVQTVVLFDQNTPTTVGVVFTPDTPLTTDVLYISTTNESTWKYNGVNYVTITVPVVNSTPFSLSANSAIDAGGNKTASIRRSGAVNVGTTTDYVSVDKFTGVNHVANGFSQIQATTYSDTLYPIIQTNRRRGTIASNSYVLNGDILGVVSLNFSATIEAKATENHSAIARGTDLIFYNRLNGTTVAKEILKLRQDGKITFNNQYTFPNVLGTNGQVLITDGLGNLTWQTPSSGGGIWGIANSSGVYTYYATYQLAVASAVAGQTIEMFGSQTESTANHILKNGVNINYNGYTLTFGVGRRIIDNGISCDIQLLNGEIKQPNANEFCIVITNSSTIIRGNVLINSSGTDSYGLYGPATVQGLNFKGFNCLYLYSAGLKGKAYGVTINCIGGNSIGYGEIYNSTINSTAVGGYSVQYVTIVSNCNGVINGNISFYMQGTSIRNSSFINLTSNMFAFGSQDDNFTDGCYFRCSADSIGRGNAQGKGLMTNTTLSCTYYMWRFDSGIMNMDKCTLIVDADYLFYLSPAGSFNACTFIVRGDFDGFRNVGVGAFKLNNCNFQLFNVAKYPIYFGSSANITASNNTYNTTNFQLNATNLQTFTSDAFGNQRLN